MEKHDEKVLPPQQPEDGSAASVVACDRRRARTRKALREALIELACERGLDGFTVNDLCARADLNRGTFYNHFRDKDDLVASFEQEIMDDLLLFRDQVAKITLIDLARLKVTKEPLPLLVDLFDYLGQQSRFLRVMLGPEGDGSFRTRLRDTICSDLILASLHARYRKNPTPFVDYYVVFYASAYLGVITRWLEGGQEESSEEMARIAMRLLFIKPGEPIKL